MLLSFGSNDAEIFFNAVLVCLTFMLEACMEFIRWRFLKPGGGDGKAHGSSSNKSGNSLPLGIQQMAQEVANEEREVEELNTPGTFVQYAKKKRAVALKKAKLEFLTKEAHLTSAFANAQDSRRADFVSTPPQSVYGELRRLAKDALLRSRFVVVAVLFLLSFVLLPPEVRRYAGWRRIASASFLTSTALKPAIAMMPQRRERPHAD